MLIKTTEEFQKAVPVLKNLTFTSIESSLNNAVPKFIIPILGKETYDYLETKLANNSLNIKDLALLEIVQRLLGNAAYYLAMPDLINRTGELGINVATPQNGSAKPSPQNYILWLQRTKLDNISAITEECIEFLETNYADFPLWFASDACSILYENFIVKTSDLNQYIHNIKSRRTFIALKPYIRTAEIMILDNLLGEDFVDDLRKYWADYHLKADLTNYPTEYADLILHIKPIIAFASLEDALAFLELKLDGDSLQIVESSDLESKKSTDFRTLEHLQNSCQSNKANYLLRLEKYLKKNALLFPIYANSELYLNTQITDYQPDIDNSRFKASFGF